MSRSRRIAKLVLRTALQAIPTILVILVVDFFLLQMAPGDAADVLAGQSGSATAETMQTLRESYGLDLPIPEQFISYVRDLAHFSLGFSPRYNMPVATMIGQRLPGTLILMAVALSVALILGVALGALMAAQSGRWPDRFVSILALLFYSIPSFWIGLMLVVLFSIKLGWLPSGGFGAIGKDLHGIDFIADRARYMLLPAISLALFYVAIYARLTRAAMLEIKTQDFVRTAAAKGLSPVAITLRHVLRNALLPVTTMAGLHMGGLMGGAVVVETVYNWPGLGRLTFEAVMGRDYKILLGVLLLSSLVVITANLMVDMVQALLDPRIEVR